LKIISLPLHPTWVGTCTLVSIMSNIKIIFSPIPLPAYDLYKWTNRQLITTLLVLASLVSPGHWSYWYCTLYPEWQICVWINSFINARNIWKY
jgi:hypothetical protein